jgi:DNA replication protein DnaC
MVSRIERLPDSLFVIEQNKKRPELNAQCWKFRCEIHGEFTAVVTMGRFDLVQCRECRDERMKTEAGNRLADEFRKKLVQNHGVPADNAHATFEDFRIRKEDGEQTAFGDSVALHAVEDLFDSLYASDPYSALKIVAIYGDKGNGLSYLGAALVSAAVKRSRSAYMIRSSELVDLVQSSGKNRTDKAVALLMRQFTAYDVLVIDDLDPAVWSQASNPFFADLILNRYSAMKPTLVLSHEIPMKVVAAFGPAVENRFKKGRTIVLKGSDRHKTTKEVTA